MELMMAARTAAIYEVTVRGNDFIAHKPHQKQRDALDLWDDFDVLVGGAAGGGKSDYLLMAALQWVDEPKYSAILFRQTYTNLSLPGGLIDRSHEWLANTPAKWYERDKRWVFPSGASMSFGYLEHRGDERRYQSAEFQFIGIDQVDDFSEDRQVHFLKSRLRRTEDMKVPIRFRCTANPGGPGHAWLLSWYVGERRDLGAKHHWTIDHGNGKVAKFVFSKCDDNPSLDREQYINTSLAHLPSAERAQLLEGDWWAFRGGEFMRREWFQGEMDSGEIRDHLYMKPRCKQWIRFWDLAASESDTAKYTVGVRMGKTPGKPDKYYIDHVVRGKWTAGKRDEVIAQRAIADGPDVKQYIEQEPGSGGLAQIEYIRNAAHGCRVYARLPKGKKIQRAKPFAAEAEKGNVQLVSGNWNHAFLDELEACREDGKSKYMDQVDAASGAFNELHANRAVIRFV
jgi:predicted phage terminase large subunit-like protein